ncbi:hypothetical protein LIER_33806 [Lithospermum erythrorhizon]|uniref:Uncharacterized protein n=1 Tax=Lithospermum erythrorhizon TaxID=34254 RepID=A0AAV3RZH4_LITER
MAAQYTPLVHPYAAFAQVMKHINQAVNGAFVVAKRADHLELENNSLNYKMEGMKKAISFKNNLNKELDMEYRDQKANHEEEPKRMEALEESCQDMDETDHIQFANSTLRSFISSPAYEKKMGSECASYFHSLVVSTSERFPDLIALFNEEMARCPDWYRGLTLPLPKGAVLLEEGGETPNLPIEEDHPAKP